jgi:hypothetical protein
VTDPNELIQQPSLESFRIENRTSKSVLSAHAVVLNEAKDLWSLLTESAHGTKMHRSFASFSMTMQLAKNVDANRWPAGAGL